MSFELTTLGRYASVQGGFAYKSKDFSEFGTCPVLKIKNIRFGHVDYSEAAFIDNDLAEETANWATKEGDILISMTGSGPNAPQSLVGRVARVWKDEPKAWINQRVGRLQLKSSGSIHTDFLFYVLSSSRSQDYLVSNSSGSANQANISGKTIESLPCPKVNYEQSEAIAKVLKKIDEKIVINHQSNQTLEEMAQAIFKSWFVDFEPVKAKTLARANGQDPERAAMCTISGKTEEELDHLPPDQLAQLRATAALFPDKLIDSELGIIPMEWVWSTIGKEVDVVGGGTPSTKNPDFWEGGNFHWTTPKDLSGNQDKVLLTTARKITEAGLGKISSGLLPVDTVLLSSRAPVGYLALAKVPVAVNQGYIAMKCTKKLPPVYVLQWTNAVMDDIKQRASGTTFAEISKKNFRIIPVLLPTEKILISYSQKVNCLYDKITKSISEIATLTQLRDTLLPKLLSGEISVKAAESTIQEVA